MKKIVLMIAALLMLSTADADAQGFLKKLKQKAQQAVSGISSDAESEDANEDNTNADEADGSNTGQRHRAQAQDLYRYLGWCHHSQQGIYGFSPDEGTACTALCREDGPQFDGGA